MIDKFETNFKKFKRENFDKSFQKIRHFYAFDKTNQNFHENLVKFFTYLL